MNDYLFSKGQLSILYPSSNGRYILFSIQVEFSLVDKDMKLALYDDSCEKGQCSDTLSADAVFTLGAAYIGDRAPGATIQGEYSGFIGCIQDIKLDHQMLIPKELLKDPNTAQNAVVSSS